MFGTTRRRRRPWCPERLELKDGAGVRIGDQVANVSPLAVNRVVVHKPGWTRLVWTSNVASSTARGVLPGGGDFAPIGDQSRPAADRFQFPSIRLWDSAF